MTRMTARRSVPAIPQLHAHGTGYPGYDVCLVRLPQSAALARLAARTTMKCWGLSEDLTADAELIACELFTNAIRHSGRRNMQEPGHCRLTLERPASDAVRIEVSDSSTTRPAKREPGEDETGGRGLVLVAALAADWGVTRRQGGKTVWALLSAQP
ncbi:ATP-binding protein [Streptomyces sp. NPDC058534]|uniref:ATP-binding protein n=1 Tax=Streptomyces sp. NPDC058534 TaxID=3346541 RepID=UPI003663470C